MTLIFNVSNTEIMFGINMQRTAQTTDMTTLRPSHCEHIIKNTSWPGRRENTHVTAPTAA